MRAASSNRARIRGLALSCHPLPTLAVTLLSAGLAVQAGLGAGRVLLVTLAVLAGQLSIGWSNDRIDAARDSDRGRSDKPVAQGAVGSSTVTVAAGSAAAAALVLSALLGPRAGAAALLIVVCGWAYNLGLKATALSWLPYALAFGALPAVATLARTPPRWPPYWAWGTGALLGVAAHLANVLPDLADDVATGVRGLPHRLGAPVTARLFAGLLVVAAALALLGPSGHNAVRWTVLAVTVLVAAATTRLRTDSRAFFLVAIAIAVVVLAAFGLSGADLA